VTDDHPADLARPDRGKEASERGALRRGQLPGDALGLFVEDALPTALLGQLPEALPLVREAEPLLDRLLPGDPGVQRGGAGRPLPLGELAPFDRVAQVVHVVDLAAVEPAPGLERGWRQGLLRRPVSLLCTM